jgi:hypothetical protein
MGRRARSTVAEKFSLGVMVGAYERLFMELMGLPRPAAVTAHG